MSDLAAVGSSSYVPAVLNFTTEQLLDKVVNLTLYKADGSFDQILTPPPAQLEGRKPTIRIKGKLVTQDTLLQVEIRVTNLYVNSPLSSYKHVDVEAGYASAKLFAFGGDILVAYQELPGPDGVTAFTMILGSLSTWRTSLFSGTYKAQQMLSSVCGDIAGRLGLTLQYNISPDIPIPIDIQYAGLTKDLLHHVKTLFTAYDPDTNEDVGVQICPYGDKLIVYYSDQGVTEGIIYRLDFITHAKHNSAGFEIMAPWIPALAPGSLILIDPKYFRQDFGGSQVAIGNKYRIYMIDFDFCTTDSTNMMTLTTVGAG
jgi:hypothetical protein